MEIDPTSQQIGATPALRRSGRQRQKPQSIYSTAAVAPKKSRNERATDGGKQLAAKKQEEKAKRYSFTFESPPSQLRSILQKPTPQVVPASVNKTTPSLASSSTPAIRAARQVSKRAARHRQFMFRLSLTRVVEITPLHDKPAEQVRMPIYLPAHACTSRLCETAIEKVIEEEKIIELDSDGEAGIEENLGGSSRPDENKENIDGGSGKKKLDAGNVEQLWATQLLPEGIDELLGRSRQLDCNLSAIEELLSWMRAWRKKLSTTGVDLRSALKDKQKCRKRKNKKGGRSTKKRSSHRNSSSPSTCGDEEPSSTEENDEGAGMDGPNRGENEFTFDGMANSPLPNPLIVSGPCSSGKTSLIHCAAKALGIAVLEVNASERRNGGALREKLAGALESHYVKKQATPMASKSGQFSIRDMLLSPGTSKNGAKNVQHGEQRGQDCSLILIDDCDIIFPTADEGFWPALRAICEESHIPIVLTCTNFAQYVQPHVESWATPSGMSECSEQTDGRTKKNARPIYKHLALERADCMKLASWLGGWLSATRQGDAGKAAVSGNGKTMIEVNEQEDDSLLKLVQSKGADQRAMINHLQLYGRTTLPPLQKEGASKAVGRNRAEFHPQPTYLSTEFSNNAHRLRLHAMLDTQYSTQLLRDAHTMPSSFLGTFQREWVETSHNPTPDLPFNRWDQQAVAAEEGVLEVPEIVRDYFTHSFEATTLKKQETHSSHPLQACKDVYASFVRPLRRSSSAGVALDYLPCLLAIHRAHIRRLEADDIGARSTLQRRRRLQHPFETVDQDSGQCIDVTGRLKSTIVAYAFHKEEKP